MANNVVITPGTGDTVAAEDISSVKYQLVKLVDSTSTSTTRTGVAANPIQVSLANTGANSTAVKVDNSAVTQPVSGSVKVIPNTSGGLTTYHLVSANSTNAVVVKASAGQVYGWYIYNSNAAARKLVFHNTASTPTAGSSVFFSLMIPASSGANVFSETGIAFGTGIAFTTVTELADTGTTAVAASDLIINIWYA